jgi:hypothetical protein
LICALHSWLLWDEARILCLLYCVVKCVGDFFISTTPTISASGVSVFRGEMASSPFCGGWGHSSRGHIRHGAHNQSIRRNCIDMRFPSFDCDGSYRHIWHMLNLKIAFIIFRYFKLRGYPHLWKSLCVTFVVKTVAFQVFRLDVGCFAFLGFGRRSVYCRNKRDVKRDVVPSSRLGIYPSVQPIPSHSWLLCRNAKTQTKH